MVSQTVEVRDFQLARDLWTADVPVRIPLDTSQLFKDLDSCFITEAIFMSADRQPRGWHARGYVPHFDSPERIQHVILRSAGSLPGHLATGVTPAEIDGLLDTQAHDSIFADPRAASIIQGALLHFDGIRYRLLGWCVMANHVHAVVQQIAGYRLGDIVASWKGYSVRAINRALGRSGPVWAPDYFDRYVRDETQLFDLLNYVENNPVSAGLVDAALDWSFSSARWRRN